MHEADTLRDQIMAEVRRRPDGIGPETLCQLLAGNAPEDSTRMAQVRKALREAVQDGLVLCDYSRMRLVVDLSDEGPIQDE